MAKNSVKHPDTALFASKLKEYKKLIDEDIDTYAKQVKKSTLQQYGEYSRLATDAYLSILQRGGKRIRGALTIIGYEMSGGENRDMILQAARAVEMIHAYILIIDDINDRSPVRRGGPAAHKLLSDFYVKQQLGNDAAHFGESIAMNAALLGNHAAQMIMANLDVDHQLCLNAISILNRSMVVTAHGQFNDIFNEVIGEVSESDIDRVLQWKTAHYTILNPLHVGMVLAGAGCDATDAITPYAMHTGRAFQITDDILGTFGSEHESGKSPLDDIQEGKRTMLTVYALKQAKTADKNYLIQMLGNHNLTPTQFQRCQDILVETGALKYSQDQAKQHVEKALTALNSAAEYWNKDGVAFLSGLANYILSRTS